MMSRNLTRLNVATLKQSARAWLIAALPIVSLVGCSSAPEVHKQLVIEELFADATPVVDGVAYGICQSGDIWQLTETNQRKVVKGRGGWGAISILTNGKHIFAFDSTNKSINVYPIAEIESASEPLLAPETTIIGKWPMPARPVAVGTDLLAGWIAYGLGTLFVYDVNTWDVREFKDVGGVTSFDGGIYVSKDIKSRIVQVTSLVDAPSQTPYEGVPMGSSGGDLVASMADGVYVVKKDGTSSRITPRPRLRDFLLVCESSVWCWADGKIFHYREGAGTVQLGATDRGPGFVFTSVDDDRALAWDSTTQDGEDEWIWLASRLSGKLTFKKWLAVRGLAGHHGSVAIGNTLYLVGAKGVYKLEIPKTVQEVAVISLPEGIR